MITFLTPFWRRDALGHSYPYLAFIRKRGMLPLFCPSSSSPMASPQDSLTGTIPLQPTPAEKESWERVFSEALALQKVSRGVSSHGHSHPFFSRGVQSERRKVAMPSSLFFDESLF